MNRSHFQLVLRVFLGGFLLATGFMKLGDASAFARLIANYRMLPAQANQLLAVTIPWVEVLVGALLILGIWLRPAAIAATLLFAAFAVGGTQALARGLHIECGCFDPASGQPLSPVSLAIQAGGLTAAVIIALLQTAGEIEGTGTQPGQAPMEQPGEA